MLARNRTFFDDRVFDAFFSYVFPVIFIAIFIGVFAWIGFIGYSAYHIAQMPSDEIAKQAGAFIKQMKEAAQ